MASDGQHTRNTTSLSTELVEREECSPFVKDATMVKPQDGNRKDPVRRRWNQVFIWTLKVMSSIMVGLCAGFSPVLATQFKSPGEEFQVDDETISWIVSAFSFATLLGCIVGGVAADWLGRRRTAAIALVCLAGAWFLTAVAQNVPSIIAGRVITAVAMLAFIVNIMIYVDEMADPKLRDFIMFSSAPLFNVGIAVMSAMMNVSWRISAWMSLGYCGMLLVAIWLFPESPTWLVRNNRFDEALRCLEWIWGPSCQKQVNDELTQLKRQAFLSKSTKTQSKPKRFSLLVQRTKYLLKPRLLKPFLIMLGFNILHLLCGQEVYTHYPTDVITRMKSTDNGLGAVTINTVVSAARIVVGILGAISIFKVGRRTMSITSGVSCGLSSFFVGAVLYLYPNQLQDWVVLTILICFVSSGEYGVRLLPIYMIGETQPSEVRGLFTGIIQTANQLLLGLIIKLYPTYSYALGIQALFLVFGVFCLIFALYAYLLLPETQGRNLYDVEEYFSQSNIFWFNRKR